jgi:hypothetical protein
LRINNILSFLQKPDCENDRAFLLIFVAIFPSNIMIRLLFFCCFCWVGCSVALKPMKVISVERQSFTTGSAFYKSVETFNWKNRDSLAIAEIGKGNIPEFLRTFVPIKTVLTDSFGHQITAVFYVMPDYLAVGNNEDWARIPLTPMAAQRIADSFQCFLPTRKMVDAIYKQSKIKLAPIPLTTHRDSSITMWQHHLLVEEQRKGRTGLISGIKKDVVISAKINKDSRPNRVAIYGWHLLDGKPIQPLYTGHVNWYVDYSHGIRLVYRTIWVNGKKMDYVDVLKHPVYQKLLCDEADCDFFRY